MNYTHGYEVYKIKSYIEYSYGHEVCEIESYTEYTYGQKVYKIKPYIEHTHGYKVYEIEPYIECFRFSYSLRKLSSQRLMHNPLNLYNKITKIRS